MEGRAKHKGRILNRVVTVICWIAIIAGLLYLARTPLQRLRVMVRIWNEELQPPLLVPVKGVHRSALYDSWGEPRSGGRRHEGIDIMARCGHPVVSATEGIVTSVGENNLGGQVVWVFGPGGSLHYYAHLSRFADIHRWDHVQAGDLLGYVGNTGQCGRGTLPPSLRDLLEGGSARPLSVSTPIPTPALPLKGRGERCKGGD